MPQTAYSYTTAVSLDFQTALNKITERLKAQGFGVLTQIDVKAKIREKLGKDMEDYTILGVCNPILAYEALQAETEVGLLMPCNVIVYRKNGQTHVAAIRPSVVIGRVENPKLKSIADQAEPKLKAALDSLA